MGRRKWSQKESGDSTILRLLIIASFQVSDLRPTPLVGSWEVEADSTVRSVGL